MVIVITLRDNGDVDNQVIVIIVTKLNSIELWALLKWVNGLISSSELLFG